MSVLYDILGTILDRRYPWQPGDGGERPVSAMTAELLGRQGEITGMGLARDLLDRFAAMDDAEKRGFFDHLSTELDLEPQAVRDSVAAYAEVPDRASYSAFLTAAEPPRQELIRRLNRVPGATGRLVAMRADLLRLIGDDGPRAALDLDFRHLFQSWFNRGFLVLRPVSWDSPASLLEKIIAYEAVHAIGDWDDLRRRVQPADRRCFAYFHPAMPDEPLIFVEVALTKGIPGSIQGLLAEDRTPVAADQADTAVFYSISNCQEGLAGISFGNSLIKQVVSDLAVALPGLKTFVTLSPIPGLTRWMTEEGLDPASLEAEGLVRAAARYLLTAKRPDGSPRDPVARFHLGNGAEVRALHTNADVSEKGRAESAGVMVNYLYDLNRISQNHERYATGGDVAASDAVRGLIAKPRRQWRKEEGTT